jgi:hypothetical protein
VSGGRSLFVLRRRVPAAESPAYDARWGAFAGAARAAGLNAWRFRQAADPEERLEFLEGPGGLSLQQHPYLVNALEALDAAHPPAPGEAGSRLSWNEVPDS